MPNLFSKRLTPTLLDKGILHRLNVIENGSYDLYHLLLDGHINFSMLGLTKVNPEPGIRLKIIKHYPIFNFRNPHINKTLVCCFV